MRKKICLLIFSLATSPFMGQNYEWAKRIGGNMASSESVVTDRNGYVYICGWFDGTVDFNPGPGIANITSAGGFDIYIAKYDYSGNYVWAINMGGASDDFGASIALDKYGSKIVVTGSFVGTADFDPGPLATNITSSGGFDVFLAKYDVNGNFLWAKDIGGNDDDSGELVKMDAVENIYLTGSFSATADFDPGSDTVNLTSRGNADIFLAKYDRNGNYNWALSMGDSGGDYGQSLVIDEDGIIDHVYIAGTYTGTVDFDPGPGTDYLTIPNSVLSGTFLAKYDDKGYYKWAKGLACDADYYDGFRLSLTRFEDHVYLTGAFWGTVDFDPGSETAFQTSAGEYDIFLAKYTSSGNYTYAKAMGGTKFDMGNAIAADDSGNVYITGVFDGTSDFDPGPATANLTSAGTDESDIFIAKYDPNGDYLGAKRIGGNSLEFSTSLTTDNDNLFLTGYFWGAADFDPGPGLANLISAGAANAFIAKYNSILTIGINENALPSEISLYPNPAKQFVTLTFEKPIKEKLSIVIVNMLGQNVYMENLPVGILTKQINIASISSGIYFYNIINDKEKIVTGKLVIQ